MKTTHPMERQSSQIHSRIRKAEFVTTSKILSEKFKYLHLFHRWKYFDSWKSILRKRGNLIRQKAINSVNKINFGMAVKDTSIWFIEVAIEGATANFATHYLLGSPLTSMTILAHGIVIKQGIRLYWEMRKDGKTAKVSK